RKLSRCRATTIRPEARHHDLAFGAAAVVVLLPTWLGLFGAWHWVLDLFAHFRWQYLIASAMVLAIAAWRSQRVVIAIAAMALLLNVFLSARLAWHPGSAGATTAAGPDLSVLSLKVHRSNPRR